MLRALIDEWQHFIGSEFVRMAVLEPRQGPPYRACLVSRGFSGPVSLGSSPEAGAKTWEVFLQLLGFPILKKTL